MSNDSPLVKTRSITVGAKIFAIIGLTLAALIAFSATAIYQMSNIGAEVVALAERDIPLSNIISKITTHQLEQALNLERAMRFAEEMQYSADVATEFEHAADKFHEYAELVDGEILEGEELVAKNIEQSATEADRAEFEHVASILKKVEIEHGDFDKHGNEIIELLEAGEIDKAIEKAVAVEIEEEELDHELEALTEEVEEFTAEAAMAAEELEKFAVQLLIAMCIALTLVVVAASWFLVRRSLVRPLALINQSLAALIAGETDVEIPVLADDEIGKVATSLEEFRRVLVEKTKVDAEEIEKRAAADRKKAMDDLAEGFEGSVKEVVDQVSQAAGELQTTAKSMRANAEESTRQTTTVAAGTEEATANVETVASAAEELSSSINEISRQVMESSKIAANAVDEAKRTNDEMKGLADAAQKIGEVIGLINDIASQTNLLALNATIEAARAGEAGKGFAVVASEVKNLANQTAKATEDITAQVGDIQEASNKAVGTIQSIGDTIDQINAISSSIAGAVEEQSAATGEISRNVKDAADGTQEVSRNIGGIAEASQATASAAEQVLNLANALADRGKELNGEVENFLRGVRGS